MGCLIELKLWEVSRNSFSNWFWKFQLSILKNKKVLFLKKYFLSRCQYQNKKALFTDPIFSEGFGDRLKGHILKHHPDHPAAQELHSLSKQQQAQHHHPSKQTHGQEQCRKRKQPPPPSPPPSQPSLPPPSVDLKGASTQWWKSRQNVRMKSDISKSLKVANLVKSLRY